MNLSFSLDASRRKKLCDTSGWTKKNIYQQSFLELAAVEHPFGVQRALRRVFVLEEQEHVFPFRQKLLRRHGDALSLPGRVPFLAQPEVNEVRRGNRGHFELVRFSPAQCGVLSLKEAVDGIRQPRFVTKLKCAAQIPRQAVQEAVQNA